jgi:hypothetical protein
LNDNLFEMIITCATLPEIHFLGCPSFCISV